MTIITDEHCAGYAHPGHPERPERILKTIASLRSNPALSTSWLKAEACPAESLLRVHTQEHLDGLGRKEAFDLDTPTFDGLPDFARVSAGAAVQAMHLARQGEPAFSLMRPPGHHATRTRAMGFCYINNMAVAALEALASGTGRIAVFDFDVHHGNGTEAILLNVPGAAFYSVHQHPCYPGTGTRNLGTNCINFPVPPQTARGHYREVLESAVSAIADFKPDLLGVSAGFDAFAGDPLAQGTLQIEDYRWLGALLRYLEIPIFNILEGGYSEQLPDLISAYLAGLRDQAL
jgi:acetoin utilization deacetylase AcuC-like enzyme